MEQIGLKTRPKEFAFMSTTRFFFHYSALVFFSLLFSRLFLSLFYFLGKILKLLDRNKAANCAKLFTPLFIPPPPPFFLAYAVYSISQKRGQNCPNASTSRIRPSGCLAQMMRWKWNILSQSRSEKWTTQATCSKVPLQVKQIKGTICNWSDCNIFSMRFPFTTERTLQQSFPLSERVFLQSVLMDFAINWIHKQKLQRQKNEIELWQHLQLTELTNISQLLASDCAILLPFSGNCSRFKVVWGVAVEQGVARSGEPLQWPPMTYILLSSCATLLLTYLGYSSALPQWPYPSLYLPLSLSPSLPSSLSLSLSSSLSVFVLLFRLALWHVALTLHRLTFVVNNEEWAKQEGTTDLLV